MGGVFFLFQGGELNDKKKNTHTTKTLDGCHLIIHAITSQKHAGVTVHHLPALISSYLAGDNKSTNKLPATEDSTI
jgi:hypothetical protein